MFHNLKVKAYVSSNVRRFLIFFFSSYYHPSNLLRYFNRYYFMETFKLSTLHEFQFHNSMSCIFFFFYPVIKFKMFYSYYFRFYSRWSNLVKESCNWIHPWTIAIWCIVAVFFFYKKKKIAYENSKSEYSKYPRSGFLHFFFSLFVLLWFFPVNRHTCLRRISQLNR